MYRFFGIYCLLIYAPWICGARIHASKPSCSAESAYEGQARSVTCQFSEDIAVHKYSVKIFRYDFKGLNYLPEVVMECIWHPHRNHHKCRTAKGYEFEEEVSDTVTVTIPHARQHHSGRYKCDYADAEPSHEDGCDLHVRGREISCTGSTVYEGEPASVTCHYNSDLSITLDDFYVARLRPGHSEYRDVLTCIWPATGPRIMCFPSPYFMFLEDEVSHTVTLHIPAANHSHVGRYYCDTAPTRRGVALPTCYVEVKAKRTQVFSSPAKTMTTAIPPPAARKEPATNNVQREVQGPENNVQMEVQGPANNIQMEVQRPASGGSGSHSTGLTKPAIVTQLVVFVIWLFSFF